MLEPKFVTAWHEFDTIEITLFAIVETRKGAVR